LSHSESTLRHGLKEVRALAAALEAAESMTEAAAVMFRRAADAGLLVGQSIEAVAAAAMYVVSREHDRPFPLANVVEVSPVDRQAVKSAYSKLVREFDAAVAPPLPSAFVQRFASAVGLSQRVCRKAAVVAEAVIDDGVHVGQSPTGVAAAVVYGAARSCGVNVTQESLADVAFVSVVTLSRQWQRIETYVNEADS
jgi:transcription initiation factor TFIIB